MRSARNQLILLGFICQGLSWDDYFAPLAYAVLWVACLSCSRRKIHVSPFFEGALLVMGCAAGLLLAMAFGRSAHFFLGHGLVLVQAARLLRSLNAKEKILSVLIALFQVGVACTFLFDLRFVVVLLAAFWLVPRAWLELTAEPFGGAAASRSQFHPGFTSIPARLPAIRWTSFLVIGAIMVALFLLFPRAYLRTPVAAPRTGASDQETMLDSVLDPGRSGLAQSSRVIFHIDGPNLGYLRCLALTEYDGRQWSVAQRDASRPLANVRSSTLAGYPQRRVRVRNAASLGRVVPVDGAVVFTYGRFFTRPRVDAHGCLRTDTMWQTANNLYYFWIDTNAPPTVLSPALRAALVRCPPLSDRVRAWMDGILAGEADPYARARRLEAHLRDHFTYTLGAPELSRLNPLEDFLFDQREGHCERFAAALALLLRSIDIPSRVVIGYVPTSPNILSGGYNIRFKDAHAWTEACFPERGWVRLDATPRASAAPDPWGFRDLIADLDYAWSTYVVNLDAPTQSQMLTSAISAVAVIPYWARRHIEAVAGIPPILLLLFALARLRSRRRASPAKAASRPKHVEVAEHYYGVMLRLLAKRGLHRRPHQTPFEFLAELCRNPVPAGEEARTITELFCAARYGNKPLGEPERAAIERALSRIREVVAS